MAAYLVLLVAVLSRVLPNAFHATGMGFTAVGGGLLFFGARRLRWQTIYAVVALAATDVYLTSYVYGLRFHVQEYLVTWAWYGAVCLLGHEILRKKTTGRRVGVAVLASSTTFFILSNFMVWTGTMYAHTLSGLGACYAAAIPFYVNDAMSTAMTAGVLLGLPMLAASIAGNVRSIRNVAA